MRPSAVSFFALVLAASSVVVNICVAQNAPAADPATLQAPIGKIISASGSVTVEHAVAVIVQANLPSGAAQAKLGDFVYRGDVVQTGADGKVGITFADGTAFNLTSNARMVLNEFLYDPKGQSNSTLFSLTKGTFSFVAGSIATTGNMRFDTPVATMGIRGTTPHVEISDDGSVRFSTLVESKRDAVTGLPGQTQPVSRAPPARQGQDVPATRDQADSYNRLFKFDSKICRGC